MTDEAQPLSTRLYPSLAPVADEPKPVSEFLARHYPSMTDKAIEKQSTAYKAPTRAAAAATETEPTEKARATPYPTMKPTEEAKPVAKPAETKPEVKPAKADDDVTSRQDEPVEITPEVQQQVTAVQAEFTAPQLQTYLDTLDAAAADDPSLIADLRAQAEQRGGTLEQLLIDPAFIQHALKET